MAKRKRKPGEDRRPVIQPIKDYRSDEYLPYIFQIEAGILQAWAIKPDLRDGDVRDALRRLMSPLKKSGQLPPQLSGEPVSETAESLPLLDHMILLQLKEVFTEHGMLSAENLVGVLSSINHSVGSMNLGMQQQSYLYFIKGFMGGMGFHVHQLNDEEAGQLEVYLPDDDDDDSIEGDYHEIKST